MQDAASRHTPSAQAQCPGPGRQAKVRLGARRTSSERSVSLATATFFMYSTISSYRSACQWGCLVLINKGGNRECARAGVRSCSASLAM